MKKHILLFIFLFLLGCSKNNIPKYENMLIAGNSISNDDQRDINKILRKADIIHYTLIDEPDYYIEATKSNGFEDYYSIYLKKQLIYPNDSFNAAYDILKRKKSKCYKIKDADLWLFKKLLRFSKEVTKR